MTEAAEAVSAAASPSSAKKKHGKFVSGMSSMFKKVFSPKSEKKGEKGTAQPLLLEQ